MNATQSPWHDEADKARAEQEQAEGSAPPPDLLGTVLRRSDLAKLPAVSPLVKGLLDYPAAAVLVGGYGIGKTFLVVSLACCVATGRPWLGKDVERRKVLLVIGEGGSGLDLRVAAWEQGYNRGEPVADDDLIVDVQPQSLTNSNVWRRIAEQCDELGVGFVILDTFSALAPDADETKDAAMMLRHMSTLSARIGGTVLLVHHPGWGDASRTRGGYQFEGNADNVLVMNGNVDEPVFSLTRKKVKDGPSGATYWLRRKVREMSGDKLGSTSVVIEQIDPTEASVPLMERLLVALEGFGPTGATGPQLCDELGVEVKSSFYRVLRKAVAREQLVSDGARGNARYWLPGQRP